VQRKVRRAIAELSRNDSALLELGVNERSLTHKLGEYLQKQFGDWNVDCEYNRRLTGEKEIQVPKDITNPDWRDLEGKTVYPDIIVHRRIEPVNLLVVEAKKSNSTVPDNFDRLKLQAFGAPPYNYPFGLFLRLHVGNVEGQHELYWFHIGKPDEEELL
jgi:hypothetical protein